MNILLALLTTCIIQLSYNMVIKHNQQEDSMKIRFEVDSLPEPKDFWQYIVALLVERIDIFARYTIQQLNK